MAKDDGVETVIDLSPLKEPELFQVRKKGKQLWGPGCNRKTAAKLYKDGYEVQALAPIPDFDPETLKEN